MRALLKRIILWALASGTDDQASAAAELDRLAAELKK
jgi:hypothetical protein